MKALKIENLELVSKKEWITLFLILSIFEQVA